MILLLHWCCFTTDFAQLTIALQELEHKHYTNMTCVRWGERKLGLIDLGW